MQRTWSQLFGLVVALAALSPAHAAPAPAEPPPEADPAEAPDEPPTPEIPAPEPTVPRVELVFSGVGDDVYSLYGHAAMLVVDPEKRATYDRFGHEGLRGGGYGGVGNVEDIFSHFQDIFGDLFGGDQAL